MEDNFSNPIRVVETVSKGSSKFLSATGVVVGGAIGALGVHTYYQKVNRRQRNLELLLLWLARNVEIRVNDERVDLRIGPAKISFGEHKKKGFKDSKKSVIDDDDIDI